MEKAEKIAKRRSPAADLSRLRKRAAREVDEEEVEEFFAILRRMHGAVKYFERTSGGDGSRKRRAANWRPALEIGGAEEAATDGAVKVEPETIVVEPKRERPAVVLDLNAAPEESHGDD